MVTGSTGTVENNRQQSTGILQEFEKQKYKEVVNLIGKMIVDITLSHDNEESDPLPEIQQ
jgi:hypothetical protein